jgi:hypothetical protein
MTTRTNEELALMSPEEIKIYLEEETKAVFGHNYRRDRQGKIIEDGIGSPLNPSENHYRAIEKYEGSEAAAAAKQRDAKLRAQAGR